MQENILPCLVLDVYPKFTVLVVWYINALDGAFHHAVLFRLGYRIPSPRSFLGHRTGRLKSLVLLKRHSFILDAVSNGSPATARSSLRSAN